MESDNFDETWDTLVLLLVEMASSDLKEMFQLICRWDEEECAASQKDNSSAGLTSVGEQKVRQYLERYLAEDTASVTMESDNFDETWDTLILQLVEMTSSDLNELIQLICRWDEEECAASQKDDSSAGSTSVDEQKVRQYLERFFAQRSLLTDQNLDEDNKETTSTAISQKEERERPACTALSFSDTTEITEEGTVLKAQVTDEEIWTEQPLDTVTTLPTVEIIRTPKSTKFARKAKKPSGKSLYNWLKSVCKRSCCRRRHKKGSEQHKARPSKEDLSSTSLNLVVEQEDTIEKEMRNFTPPAPLSSTSEKTQDSPIEEEEDFYKTEIPDTLLKSPPTEDEEDLVKTATGEHTIESPVHSDRLEKEQNKEEPTSSISTKLPLSASSSLSTRRSFFKSMKKVWKKRLGKKKRKKLAAKCQEDDIDKERSVSPKSNQMSTPLKGQEEQDEAFGLYQLFAADKNIPAEDNKDRVIEIYLPPRTPEEDEPTEEENEPSNDQQLNLCVLSPVIERFFHCLTEEQWREVNEGVYNKDVKEKLIDMCISMLSFITNSVTKIAQSIHQSSSTSDTCDFNKSLSSEPLMEIFNCNIQSLVESSFSRAVCEVLGADTPVRISPEFTEAMAAEVLHEVNSVLSDAIQASVDGGSCSTTAPAKSHLSKGSPSEKTLAGTIKMMKSFLTGRANAVRRRIVTQKDGDTKNGRKEETQTMTTQKGSSTKWKQSVWTMCFSRRQRVQPVPLNLEDHVGDEDMTPSTISKTPEEKTGKGLWGFICNIFTKDKKKKKTEKTEEKKKK